MVDEWIVLFHLFNTLLCFKVVFDQEDPVFDCVHVCSINKLLQLLLFIMRRIAHRGNYQGKNVERENTYLYLKEAIIAGFDVEVDVWLIDDKFFLGHDGPNEEVSLDQLKFIQPFAWFHAKNYAALETLLTNRMHVFFHDQDEYTITSRGYIWAYSGKFVGPNAIACMPESTPGFSVPSNAAGICSDYFMPVE